MDCEEIKKLKSRLLELTEENIRLKKELLEKDNLITEYSNKNKELIKEILKQDYIIYNNERLIKTYKKIN